MQNKIYFFKVETWLKENKKKADKQVEISFACQNWPKNNLVIILNNYPNRYPIWVPKVFNWSVIINSKSIWTEIEIFSF